MFFVPQGQEVIHYLVILLRVVLNMIYVYISYSIVRCYCWMDIALATEE